MKFIPYFTDSSEKVVIAISLARIYVNNVAPISVNTCLVHSEYIVTNCVHSKANAAYAASMVLTGIAWVAVKFGINTTLVVLEMVNFNTTLVIFIPNFTATHAITSTNQTKKIE